MKISGEGILFYKKAMKKLLGIRDDSYFLFRSGQLRWNEFEQ